MFMLCKYHKKISYEMCVWLYGYGRGGAVLSGLILSSSDKARDHCSARYIVSYMPAWRPLWGRIFFFSFINILNILILHSFTEKLLIWHFGDFLMWISIYPVNGAKRRDPWKIYCNLCDTRFWCALQLEIIATQKAIWHIIAQFAMILTGEMYNHHHYA